MDAKEILIAALWTVVSRVEYQAATNTDIHAIQSLADALTYLNLQEKH